jgi:hypothetical protein
MTVPLPGRLGPATHRADLVLRPFRAAAPVAVEVELTVKNPQRLAAICRAWARARGLTGVLYVVTPEVRPAVERAVAQTRAERQIALVDLADLRAALSAPEPYTNAVPTAT